MPNSRCGAQNLIGAGIVSWGHSLRAAAPRRRWQRCRPRRRPSPGREEADAAKYAPSDLDRARDKLIRAQAAMQEEDNEEARRLADEALVDARSAESKARAEAAQQLQSEASGDAAQPPPRR